VRFSGHTGYARTALRAGVPVVPVAHAGAHHSLLVITDGQRIAKALRVPLLARAHIWPLHLALPWGLAFGPLPHLPLPVTLRYRVGEPIEVKRRAPGERWEPSDEDVRKLDEKVRAEIQKLLDHGRGRVRAPSPLASRTMPIGFDVPTAQGGPRALDSTSISTRYRAPAVADDTIAL
jgi:1-acyl-sn-glycerol-3-phosphate acyltransferase